jgi:hypothetical protein
MLHAYDWLVTRSSYGRRTVCANTNGRAIEICTSCTFNVTFDQTIVALDVKVLRYLSRVVVVVVVKIVFAIVVVFKVIVIGLGLGLGLVVVDVRFRRC